MGRVGERPWLSRQVGKRPTKTVTFLPSLRGGSGRGHGEGQGEAMKISKNLLLFTRNVYLCGMNITTHNNNHMKMEKKQYQSPCVKVMEVRQRQVLCESPGLNGYEEGSHSDGEVK